ncbi:hypothetical protein pb186bvf_005910 [Paramecium bursaria]
MKQQIIFLIILNNVYLFAECSGHSLLELVGWAIFILLVSSQAYHSLLELLEKDENKANQKYNQVIHKLLQWNCAEVQDNLRVWVNFLSKKYVEIINFKDKTQAGINVLTGYVTIWIIHQSLQYWTLQFIVFNAALTYALLSEIKQEQVSGIQQLVYSRGSQVFNAVNERIKYKKI